MSDFLQEGEPGYKEDRIVGYVTAGSYSLSRGCARAIGAIPLSVLLEAQERARQCVKSSSQVSESG